MSPACHSNRHNPRAPEALGKGKSVAVALFQFILFAAFFFPSQMASAGVATWRGNHNNNSFWSFASNWTTPTQITKGNLDPLVPNDSLVFEVTNRVDNFNDTAAGTSYAGITFNGGSAFILRGNRITLTNSIINNSAQSQTINLAMTLGATRTINTASGDIRINSVISGGGGLTKSGTEQLVLSDTNTYTGATTVSNGTLIVNAGASIATSSSTTIGAGGHLKVNGTAGAVNVTGGTLSGSGSVGALTLSSAGTLAVGNSPGELSASSATWNPGSNFQFEINNATGMAGTDWDLLSVSGNLDLTTISSSNKMNLSIFSASLQNFNSDTLYSWVFAQAASFQGTESWLSGLDVTDRFVINSDGFNNGIQPRSGFRVVTGTDGSNVTLSLVAVPEPSVAALAVIGLALTLRRRRDLTRTDKISTAQVQ